MKLNLRRRYLTVMLIALLSMTLFASLAFATDKEEGKGTDTLPGSGLISGAESILDGIESDLMGEGTDRETGTATDRETGRDTGRETATGTGTDSVTDMTEGDGGGVGLVIGIGVAVVALIIVFVILSRSTDGKK